MNEQNQVASAIKARGYTSKEPTAHAVKAALKMMEEAMDVLIALDVVTADDTEVLESYLYHARSPRTQMKALKNWFGERFDRTVRQGDDYKPLLTGSQRRKLANELADVQVTVFDLADAIQDLTGTPYDVVAEAVAKATADVQRGVRTAAPH